MSPSIRVRFEPDGVETLATHSAVISALAHEAGLRLHLPCGGHGKCGKCRVTVVSGETSPPTSEEEAALSADELANGLRLACQTSLLSDAVVEIPPETHVVGKKALNGDLVRPVAVTPNVHQVPLRLTPPRLEDQRADFDRLAQVLETGGKRVYGCPTALHNLPRVLRESNFEVVAAIVGDRLVDVHPGHAVPRTCGVAVDIGTTTVVTYVVDLLTGEQLAAAAAYNQQGRHGADVISRIEHANTHKRGLHELRTLVLQTVNEVIGEALARCGCRTDDVYEVTVVGNTAMNHLFIGLDPRNLAQAPYIPVSARPQELRPQDAGVHMHPRGSVFCLPVIAGFVGADTVGVLLATELTEREHCALAVDIGTNGEVALWSGEKLVVASCAAGPAFEGAQIEHGMRAAPGAIEHVSIGDGDLTLKTIGDVPPLGICGSGLFDAMALVLELGAVEASGRFIDTDLPASVPAGIRRRLVGEGNSRRFILSDPTQADTIYLSQRDVRELQLAKGAVRAAIDLLLAAVDLNADNLEEVLLAGAFGNYIRAESALRIGMLPPIAAHKIKGVGNAAGAGALLALISTEERERAVQLAAAAEHIELSRRPEFQMAFMETMMFP